MSEPNAGDIYAYRSPVSGWTVLEWRDGDDLHAAFKGEWILLERAKPKTLAEEARELLGRNDARHLDNYEYQAVVRDFLRRVAEQEKSDARF